MKKYSWSISAHRQKIVNSRKIRRSDWFKPETAFFSFNQIVRHMTSFRTPTRFSFYELKIKFLFPYAECANIAEILRQITLDDIGPPVINNIIPLQIFIMFFYFSFIFFNCLLTNQIFNLLPLGPLYLPCSHFSLQFFNSYF